MPTIKKAQIKGDVDAVWAMEDEEIYRLLGLAQMGTQNITEAKRSLNFVMSAAGNANGTRAMAAVEGSLTLNGKKYFKKLWAKIKEIVCKIYNDKLQIEGKDLVTYLVSAVVAAVSISNALVVLVITLAVKMGLTKMCKA